MANVRTHWRTIAAAQSSHVPRAGLPDVRTTASECAEHSGGVATVTSGGEGLIGRMSLWRRVRRQNCSADSGHRISFLPYRWIDGDGSRTV